MSSLDLSVIVKFFVKCEGVALCLILLTYFGVLSCLFPSGY